MAVDRLVEEIRKLSSQEKAELLCRLGWQVADADRGLAHGAALQRIGFGMWAKREGPGSAEWVRDFRTREWKRDGD